MKRKTKKQSLPYRKCENCDGRYKPDRRSKRFCTDGCRSMKWRELKEVDSPSRQVSA